MKPPKWSPERDSEFEKFRREHSEWHNSLDIAEMVGDERLVGFQKLTIGRTDVFKLMFENGATLRISGYKDLKDPDIIKLLVEHYNKVELSVDPI